MKSDALQHLMNKLNKVTSCHRHGREIPANYLDDLSNAQVEYEEYLLAKEVAAENAALPRIWDR
jgi:hypothetical protein